MIDTSFYYLVASSFFLFGGCVSILNKMDRAGICGLVVALVLSLWSISYSIKSLIPGVM